MMKKNKQPITMEARTSRSSGRRFRHRSHSKREAAESSSRQIPAEYHENRAASSAPERRINSAGNALQSYLNEIGRTPLLDPPQERALAKRIQRGDRAARDQLIRANLRLVVKIARDYEGQGLPLMDLISEGNIGLVKAVERFDPSKGAKLSTYAAWWIKQNIRRALINQARAVRLSIPAYQQIGRIRKAETKLRQLLDRSPTDEELANELGESEVKVGKYRHLCVNLSSLDAPADGDSSLSIGELIKDENAAMPDDVTQEKSTAAHVRELLGNLNPREQSILRHRFGFHNGENRTLEEVGAHLGVTRERIRQLQEAALTKLRLELSQREPGLFSN